MAAYDRNGCNSNDDMMMLQKWLAKEASVSQADSLKLTSFYHDASQFLMI